MQYTVAKDMYNESVTHIGLPETDFLGFIVRLDNGTFEGNMLLPQEFFEQTGIKYSKKKFSIFQAAALWIIAKTIKNRVKPTTSLF